MPSTAFRFRVSALYVGWTFLELVVLCVDFKFVHQLSRGFANQGQGFGLWIFHFIFQQVTVRFLFVLGQPLAESTQGPVTDRLFLVACCMQGILEANIKNQRLQYVVISEIE